MSQISEAMLENLMGDFDSDDMSDYELDAVEDMMSQFELEDTIKDVQRAVKRAETGYKHNFLYRYLDHVEKTIEESEKPQKAELPRPEFLRRRDEQPDAKR